jgi:hypothetical protein
VNELTRFELSDELLGGRGLFLRGLLEAGGVFGKKCLNSALPAIQMP